MTDGPEPTEVGKPAEVGDDTVPAHGTAPTAVVLYLVAFALMVLALAVIGIGAVAGFSTAYFWISIVFSIGALAAAGGAVFLPKRR